MRYLKRATMLFAVLMLLAGAAVTDASAQRRGGGGRSSAGRSHQRVIVYRPYYGSRFGYGYGGYGWNNFGFGYDPYFYDPVLREQREKYYLEKELRDTRYELRKHEVEYNRDGVITAKERKELLDNKEDYDDAERKLRKFNGYY